MFAIKIGSNLDKAVQKAAMRDGFNTRLYISKNGDKLRSERTSLSGKLLRCFGHFPHLSALGPLNKFITNTKAKLDIKNLNTINRFVEAIAKSRGIPEKELFHNIQERGIVDCSRTVFCGDVADKIRFEATQIEIRKSSGSAPAMMPPVPKKRTVLQKPPVPQERTVPQKPPVPPKPPKPPVPQKPAHATHANMPYMPNSSDILRQVAKVLRKSELATPPASDREEAKPSEPAPATMPQPQLSPGATLQVATAPVMGAPKCNLKLSAADITTLDVDAIVNAAKDTLLGGGGVDGAIHLAAGGELRKECEKLNGCATGDAKITKGYNLPARYVIHTVGPVWKDHAGDKAKELLASCYRRSIEIAQTHGLSTIAFPAISTGFYGFPANIATQIAVATVRDALRNAPSLKEVTFCCFTPELQTLYGNELGVDAA